MKIAGSIGWSLIALLAWAGPAQGQDMPAWFSVQLPQDFTYRSGRSADITGNLRQQSQLGTMAFEARAAIWESAPAASGPADAALFITWITTTAPVAEPRAAVRAQLDRMHGIPEAASLSPGETAIDTWDQAIDQGMATARLSWRHTGNQTESIMRTIIAQNAQGNLYQVSAECLRSTGSNAAVWARCQKGLDSLAITLPADRVRALGNLDAPAAAEPGSTGSGLTLTDPGDITGKDVPPIAVARPEHTNYRVWLYLIGALLLLIGVYIGNRARIRHKAGQGEDGGDERGASELDKVVRRARSHSDTDPATREKQ